MDASPQGLGAILVQTDSSGDDKVICYASRSLSDVESRYYQIEREALAICWGINHFKNYLIGHRFTVSSDHSPLQNLFNGSKKNLPPRIERWILKLQEFNFKVIYEKGMNNPSDYLSR